MKLGEADTREVELLTEPITAKACTGWKMDGTDVIRDCEITSIKLRSMGMELTVGEHVMTAPENLAILLVCGIVFLAAGAAVVRFSKKADR